jgi:hypothetical protein
VIEKLQSNNPNILLINQQSIQQLFEDGKQIIFETHPFIKMGFAKAWAYTFEAAKREKRV